MIAVHSIIGLPGVGKSSLMRKIIAKLGGLESAQEFSYGLVVGHAFADQKALILGKYSQQHLFPGTDRLSMAVQPEVQRMIQQCASAPDWDGSVILFEGDRLTSASLFSSIKASGVPLTIWELSTSDDTRQARCQARGSQQSEVFIRGRVTKIDNIRQAHFVHALHNPEGTDLNTLASRILDLALNRRARVF